MKAFEKFKNYRGKKKKKPKKKKKIKVVPVKKESDSVTAEPKSKLDHRNYGAWYISPTKYQKRFEELSDPKSIEMVKSRIMLKKEKQNKIDIKIVREKVIYNFDPDWYISQKEGPAGCIVVDLCRGTVIFLFSLKLRTIAKWAYLVVYFSDLNFASFLSKAFC